MITSRREILKAIGGLAVAGSLLAGLQASRGNGAPRVRHAKVKRVKGDGTVELVPCSAEDVEFFRYGVGGYGPWWAYRYDPQGHLKAIAPVMAPRPGTDFSPIEHRNGDATFFKHGRLFV